MKDRPTRNYSSPLREAQARRTRDLILDALTELLAELPSDEVSTKLIAERSGVSQPTVYRHFSDRAALVEGLAQRIEERARESSETPEPTTLDEWAAWAVVAFAAADDNAPQVTADAVLGGDPRRRSTSSRDRTGDMAGAVARSLPGLTLEQHLGVAALVRTLASSQTWLRLREEFGIPGSDAGPLVGWAISALAAAAREGNPPPGVRAD